MKPVLRRSKSKSRENRDTTSRKRNSANEKFKSEMAKLAEKNEVLEKELKRVSATARAIENERDFYFKVLLKVETMCKKSDPNNPDIKDIMGILYSPNNGEFGKEKEADSTQEHVPEEAGEKEADLALELVPDEAGMEKEVDSTQELVPIPEKSKGVQWT